MKILFMTDTHITARTPSSRLDDIQESIKMKFKEIGVLIQKENIEVVLHGGDMFNTPEVSNKFVGEIAEIIRGYNVPFYITPGNHDLQGQNEDSLPYSKLGLLSSTGVIKLLNRKNPIVLDDNGFKISVEGQEYHPNIDKNPSEDYKSHNQTSNFKILVSHSMLLEKPFHEGTTYTLIKDVKTNADLILAGHYHPGFKTQNVNNTWFMNPGGLVRMEASAESLKAKPKVVVLDFNNGIFTYSDYELQTAKPGKEIFSSKNLQKKTYSNSLEAFNSKLKNIKLDDVNIVNLIDEYVKTHPEDVNIVAKAKDEIVKIQREQVVDSGFVSSQSNVCIDKVVMKNFQAHESLEVDFAKGLNTITGESNAGKTAIIRAIVWALYDKPSGSAFITTGKKSCKVEVHLSNGYVVERSRSRSASGSYNLVKPDGTRVEYKGFSNNIPTDIINVHQMPEIKIAGKSYRLNISSQLEGPFMVTSSSDERMTMIGALVDADRADAARKSVNSEKRNLSASYKKIEELRETESTKLEKFGNLENIRLTVEMLEMADEKLDRDIEKVKELEDIRNDYNNTIKSKSFVDDRLASLVIPDRLDIDILTKEVDNIENLQDLKTLYMGNVFKLSQINSSLQVLGNGVDSKDIENYNALLSMVEELQELSSNYKNTSKDLGNINNQISNLPNAVDIKDVNEFNLLISNLELMSDLSSQYNKLKSQDFSFNYDLDELKKVRDEYVALMREVIEIDSLKKSILETKENLVLTNSKIESIELEIDSLNKSKQESMTRLSSETVICEHCGSEVTADKMVA